MKADHNAYHPKPVPGQVTERLKELGTSGWDLMRGESRMLQTVLQEGEFIGGIIFGHNENGHVAFVATDSRILYLDSKPMFKKAEDINYYEVGGLTLEWVALFGTLILETHIGNFKLRVTNRRMAEVFCRYVEQRCLGRAPLARRGN